jgi:hypothetical protein
VAPRLEPWATSGTTSADSSFETPRAKAREAPQDEAGLAVVPGLAHFLSNSVANAFSFGSAATIFM